MFKILCLATDGSKSDNLRLYYTQKGMFGLNGLFVGTPTNDVSLLVTSDCKIQQSFTNLTLIKSKTIPRKYMEDRKLIRANFLFAL